ncbi:putative membrane protein [Kitasatospora gansuensis]|uniref:Putative membrane protein n=1 Tax=Kitasatospora gansuensis TaxID=258050 RepID=A0A7W7WIZ6_9ACTN|nr:SHOCT domain-containing protein [Kitasatospora gansuensis]MBB4948628.1 putative membrane protein [Kitasatospora gansuensis]
MDDYPLLNLFWTMMWIFLWVLWFFLLFKIITDIFRSHDMGGWGKAGWLLFVIVLPYLGVLVYLIARGKSMTRRDTEQAQQADAAFKEYIRNAASAPGGSGGVDELAKLAALKEQGALTEEEYRKAKEKLLT